jgi:hypothetical protein
MSDPYAKFSVSMPEKLKGQIEMRVTNRRFAEDRSTVLARDVDRLYNGLLKQGMKTLRNVHLTAEERACLGTLLMSTVFSEPSVIPFLVFSLEDSQPEMRAFGVDPAALLEKIHALDLAALYALVDLCERDPTLSEIA